MVTFVLRNRVPQDEVKLLGAMTTSALLYFIWLSVFLIEITGHDPPGFRADN